MNSPVVFLIYNRPALTRRVFEEIRRARPPQLLVVADGPRPDRPDDTGSCAATRAVIQDVDWPCDVRTNYSETNLGCRGRVSSGLSWAFDQVEEAIILEDDCLPHPSFFGFCEELLRHYRHDTRVMAVCGDNYQAGRERGTGSYYFSRYASVWGWATWRRAWALYDGTMSRWPLFRDSGYLDLVCPDQTEAAYWLSVFETMYHSHVDTWDYPWVFTVFAQGGLAVRPNRNLVSNIGFGLSATHTLDTTSLLANRPTEEAGPIVHPPFFLPDRDADLSEFDLVLGDESSRRKWSLHSLRRALFGTACRFGASVWKPLRLLFRSESR